MNPNQKIMLAWAGFVALLVIGYYLKEFFL